MSAFQLDEDVNSRRLARECKQSGLSQVKRFPRKLRGIGTLDPSVLERVTPKDTLLTGDLSLARDHTRSIPAHHCGIIALGNSEEIMWTVTDKDYRRIIANFKRQFPEWQACEFSNSILTITERDVLIQHAEGQSLVDDEYLTFDSPGWQNRLRTILNANTTRRLSS
jgi:hypothetical protein